MTEYVTEKEFAPIADWLIELCKIDINAAVWLVEYARNEEKTLWWWKQRNLCNMINWQNETPQGHTYWCEIHKQMLEK